MKIDREGQKKKKTKSNMMKMEHSEKQENTYAPKIKCLLHLICNCCDATSYIFIFSLLSIYLFFNCVNGSYERVPYLFFVCLLAI